jgi:TRAP-type C4-dicarboxylate transport system substrate-binding protein
MNTRLCTLAAALGFGFTALGASAQTKWDMPTGYPAANFHTENINQFATDVDKATAGKLKITVHPGGSLFKANEIKRAVQGGQAQIGEIIFGGYANENPLFGTDNVPFLATSYAEAKKLAAAQKPAMDALLAKQGLKVLYTVPWPPQGIYSAKAINAGADLKGVKWRAYSPQTSRIAELVGAQPVTIQAAELSQALATGAVAAFMTSAATGVDSKVWEQVKFYYDTQAWLPKNAVLVNKAAFDGLDAATRQAVLKAAADAEVRGWAASRKVNVDTLARLRTEGMQVLPPSPQLKADMAKVGETMLKEWAEKAGADGKALLDGFSK